MFRTVVTLLRGHAHEAEERLADANASTLLDQQMRDAAGAIEQAKRALALAIAEDRGEQGKMEAAKAKIAELEQGAVSALQGDREDLAQRAAEAIADLEADLAASDKARTLFTAEISRLEAHVRRQSARLAELSRGRRIARAAQAVRIARRGRIETAPCHRATLAEAEATLARLRERQTEADVAESALDALDADPRADSAAEALATEGFGPAARPRAADILARLKENAAG